MYSSYFIVALSLGTSAEDFRQGYETFCYHLVGGTKLARKILMGLVTILLCMC